MAEHDPVPEHAKPGIKEILLEWILKGVSFPLMLVSFVLGVFSTVLEYRFIAPLDDRGTLIVIGINATVILLVILLVQGYRRK